MVGWGSSSAQGETAVAPMFDSGTYVSRAFLPFSAARGTGYAQAPCSRTCLSFPPTGSLFCGVVFLPALSRWRLMTPRHPRPTGSGLWLLCWWRSLLGILPYFTILLQRQRAQRVGNRPAGHFRESLVCARPALATASHPDHRRESSGHNQP